MPLTFVTQKRLDSLACLTRGNEDVAAVSFDGDTLVFANNFQKESAIFHRIKEHLTKIAKSSFELNEKSKKYAEELMNGKIQHWEFGKIIYKEYNAQKDFCNRSMEDIMNYAKSDLELFLAKDKSYIDPFTNSLKQITRSIRHTYLYNDSLQKIDLVVADAMKNGKIEFVKVPFISPRKYIVRMHAEMQILQHLKTKDNESYCIGVSKKCCVTCEKIIEAVNNINKSQIIAVRGASSEYFHSHWPPFLEANQEIKKEFFRLIGADEKSSLEDIFYGKEGEEIEHVPSKRMVHERFSSDKSTEDNKKYPFVTSTKLKKNMDDDSGNYFTEEDDESNIIENFNGTKTSEKDSQSWKRDFNEAKKSYNNGKIKYYFKDNEAALTFFLEAKEKYKAVLKNENADNEAKIKATSRLEKLKKPDGIYSTAKLKL